MILLMHDTCSEDYVVKSVIKASGRKKCLWAIQNVKFWKRLTVTEVDKDEQMPGLILTSPRTQSNKQAWVEKGSRNCIISY